MYPFASGQFVPLLLSVKSILLLASPSHFLRVVFSQRMLLFLFWPGEEVKGKSSNARSLGAHLALGLQTPKYGIE